ncbi:hypothetical protein SAMN05421881_10888, partial [Nitrosomonas halophila]
MKCILHTSSNTHRVDTLSSVKQNLHISALYFEKLVTIKRHVVMQ